MRFNLRCFAVTKKLWYFLNVSRNCSFDDRRMYVVGMNGRLIAREELGHVEERRG